MGNMERIASRIDNRNYKSIEIIAATNDRIIFEGRFAPDMVVFDNGLIDIEDHKSYLHIMIPLRNDKIDVIDEDTYEIGFDGVVFTIYF